MGTRSRSNATSRNRSPCSQFASRTTSRANSWSKKTTPSFLSAATPVSPRIPPSSATRSKSTALPNASKKKLKSAADYFGDLGRKARKSRRRKNDEDERENKLHRYCIK